MPEQSGLCRRLMPPASNGKNPCRRAIREMKGNEMRISGNTCYAVTYCAFILVVVLCCIRSMDANRRALMAIDANGPKYEQKGE